MTVKVTLGPNLGYNGGAYPLLVDGKEVGRVQKYEKRYHLRRTFVDKGWLVVGVAGFDGRGGWERRKDAVAAVEAHLNRQESA